MHSLVTRQKLPEPSTHLSTTVSAMDNCHKCAPNSIFMKKREGISKDTWWPNKLKSTQVFADRPSGQPKTLQRIQLKRFIKQTASVASLSCEAFLCDTNTWHDIHRKDPWVAGRQGFHSMHVEGEKNNIPPKEFPSCFDVMHRDSQMERS